MLEGSKNTAVVEWIMSTPHGHRWLYMVTHTHTHTNLVNRMDQLHTNWGSDYNAINAGGVRATSFSVHRVAGICMILQHWVWSWGMVWVQFFTIFRTELSGIMGGVMQHPCTPGIISIPMWHLMTQFTYQECNECDWVVVSITDLVQIR